MTLAAGMGGGNTIPAASTGPTGPAGGVLSGTYPNPGFAVDMATQAELDALQAAAALLAAANTFVSPSAASVPVTIKGAASQTGHLLDFRDSANTIIGQVLADGSIVTSFAALYGAASAASNGYASVFIPDATNRIAQVIQGLASQSANLTEWRNSAGTRVGQVSGTGNARFPTIADLAATGAFTTYNATGTANGSVVVDARSAGNVPLAVQAAASQTARLLDIRSSSGSALMAFRADAALRWVDAALQQTTVGAAGGGSVPPLTPVKYLVVYDSADTKLVVPAYNP